MSSDEQQYIIFKLNQAKETYAAAEIMFENKMYNSVANRIYYSSFVEDLFLQTKTFIQIIEQFIS
jgi:uncharacterized protein (UPF0332 family)